MPFLTEPRYNLKKIFAIATLSAAAFAAPVIASEAGPYVGASVGYSKFYVPTLDGVAVDRDGASVSAYGGYNFDKHFGLEVGYTRFADAKFSSLGETASIKPHAFTLEGTARYEIFKNATLFGKAGLAYTKANTLGESFDKYGAVAGFGLDYALAESVNVRMQVQYLPNFADSDENMVNASVGLTYAF